MGEKLPYADYQTYLASQKQIFTERLTRALNASESEYTFRPDREGRPGVFNELTDTLACFLSPVVRERRDQLISMGLPADLTQHIDWDGDQNRAALNVTILLSRIKDTELTRQIASGLQELTEKL